jgi:hypothetical protein
VRGQRGVLLGIAGAALVSAVPLAGCGAARQDANEKSGTYRLTITGHDFPSRQHLAKRANLVLRVRNADNKTVPNVAVTIGDQKGQRTFGQASQMAGLADAERPIWVIDAGPRGGTTAYVNTWALGALRPGQEKTFRWRVTAVKAGTYAIDYQVAAGLNGKAKAVAGGGQPPSGTFQVRISGRPAQARVDDNGNVVRSSG